MASMVPTTTELERRTLSWIKVSSSVLSPRQSLHAGTRALLQEDHEGLGWPDDFMCENFTPWTPWKPPVNSLRQRWVAQWTPPLQRPALPLTQPLVNITTVSIGWHHIDFDKVPGPDGFILRLGFQKAYKKKAVTLLPCCFCKGNA